MFDKLRLKEAVAEYKKRFVQTQWPDEKYKWEAVKCFQVNWDVNSDDFAQMLTKRKRAFDSGEWSGKRKNGNGWQNCMRTAMVVLLLSLDIQMAAHRMV